MSDSTSSKYTYGYPLTPNFQEKTSQGTVALVMGSTSDWEYFKPCADTLEQLEVPFVYGVLSAHRTPKRMSAYVETAEQRNVKVIIACAGGSAHLPGMSSSETDLPVLAVAPKKTDSDAIGSMIAMPAGVPLAFMGSGRAGAINAALFAVKIVFDDVDGLRGRYDTYKHAMRESVPFAP